MRFEKTNIMAENLSYNPYRDMHNDVQFSAMFFGENFQNIPLFNSTQTIEAKSFYYSFERFTFTGKEREAETSFSYFGARYYDLDLMTGWLSVDPMADKYPGLSPYAYCAWNSVKLVDPDGEGPIFSLAGALVGATVNTVCAVMEGKSGTELVAAAVGCAITGAVVSTNPLASVAASAAGNYAEQQLNVWFGNKENVDGVEVAVASGFGVIGGKAEKIAKANVKNKAEKVSLKIGDEIKESVKAETKKTYGTVKGHSIQGKINRETRKRIKNYKEQKEVEGKTKVDAISIAIQRYATNKTTNDVNKVLKRE